MGRPFQYPACGRFLVRGPVHLAFPQPGVPRPDSLDAAGIVGLPARTWAWRRLFWSEIWAVQLGCGLAVGMLFGVVLFVWYLLDRPRRAVDVASRSGRPSLFPSRTDIRVRRLVATRSGRCRSSWL